MIATLGLIAAFVLSLVALVARGLLTDEIKGCVQQRTRAHLDATLEELPAEVRACWEDEWRAELAAKLGMPVTAWQLVCGIRRTAAELVAEPEPATARQTDGARGAGSPTIRPPQRVTAALGRRVRVLVSLVNRAGVAGVVVAGVVVAGVVVAGVVVAAFGVATYLVVVLVGTAVSGVVVAVAGVVVGVWRSGSQT